MPTEYQSQLNEFGQRRDRESRSELKYGAYEFNLPPLYLKPNPPTLPVFVFVIETSFTS